MQRHTPYVRVPVNPIFLQHFYAHAVVLPCCDFATDTGTHGLLVTLMPVTSLWSVPTTTSYWKPEELATRGVFRVRMDMLVGVVVHALVAVAVCALVYDGVAAVVSVFASVASAAAAG